MRLSKNWNGAAWVSETLGDWLRRATSELSAVGVESANLEAQVMAAAAYGVDRTQILIHPEWPVHPEAELILSRRLKREPLAYILGWREFYGHRFSVGPGVLIPRQETETLVEAALALELPPDARVLDIGCGSGAICISLALARPSWQVEAVDISPMAVEFTKRNALALAANISVSEQNVFRSSFQYDFALIVSNPPYVRTHDPLQPEVGVFEPAEALFGGEDGLVFYRDLAARGTAWLRPEGWMLLEVGDDQASEVEELFRASRWRVQASVEDLGGVPRVVRAQRL